MPMNQSATARAARLAMKRAALKYLTIQAEYSQEQSGSVLPRILERLATLQSEVEQLEAN